MTISVLAIDDSRTMRGMLAQALENAGFEVALAEDGQQGLDKLEDSQPDVVITDINMPRLDGFGFIKGVRGQSRLRGLPILILTTESSPALKARARDAGATGWIVKPFDEGKLVSAIHKVVVR